uniref:ZAD domain-containing protein n=1 Tax=Anopheles dirus TaxID=7168 RepID=A0A182NB37_9DIPT
MDSNSLLSMNLALNVARKCRICGMDILDLTCAFPIFGNDRLDQKLDRYLQLRIQIDDLLPKCICGSCYLKLESIDQFALMANRTEEAFRAWITRLRGLNCPVEAAKNVNVVLPLFRPNPEGTERKKGHIFLPPKDPPANPIPTADSPNSASSIATEKGVISYSDLKLGLLIKDQELLKLILKALKWAENDRRASFEVLIQRLKNTSFREILSNRNLLNDSDLTQLLKSYIGQGVMNSFAAGPAGAVTLNNNVPPTVILQQQQQSAGLQSNQTNENLIGSNKVKIKNVAPSIVTGLLPPGASNVSEYRIEDGGVTQMEVGVDPDLYLPYEDEDSSSTTKFDGRIDDRQENTVTIKLVTTNVAGDMIENRRMIPAILNVRGNKRFKCSACPECFETNAELQQHIVTRHLPRTNRTVITQQGKPAIKIRVRKSKPLVGSTTSTVISSSPLALPMPSPSTATEQTTSPSPSPTLKIVPLKIPASTTITVVPVPSQVKPAEPETNDDKLEPNTAAEKKPEIPDVKPPKEDVLVRKSKRKSTIKCDSNVEKLKTRKIRKEEPPAKPPSPLPSTSPKTRKATVTTYCALCRKKLAPQETLRKHMEREHSLYECEKCDRTFKSALNLGRHQQYHASVATTTSLTKPAAATTQKSAPKATSQPPGEEPTTHKCTHCEKAFRRSHHLKLHLRHHAKDVVPRAAEEKPASGNGLRSRTKLTHGGAMPVSILRSAEGSRTRNSDATKRKVRALRWKG